jgi:hypothetical protein
MPIAHGQLSGWAEFETRVDLGGQLTSMCPKVAEMLFPTVLSENWIQCQRYYSESSCCLNQNLLSMAISIVRWILQGILDGGMTPSLC